MESHVTSVASETPDLGGSGLRGMINLLSPTATSGVKWPRAEGDNGTEVTL